MKEYRIGRPSLWLCVWPAECRWLHRSSPINRSIINKKKKQKNKQRKCVCVCVREIPFLDRIWAPLRLFLPYIHPSEPAAAVWWWIPHPRNQYKKKEMKMRGKWMEESEKKRGKKFTFSGNCITIPNAIPLPQRSHQFNNDHTYIYISIYKRELPRHNCCLVNRMRTNGVECDEGVSSLVKRSDLSAATTT